jgi:hypothetical protein
MGLIGCFFSVTVKATSGLEVAVIVVDSPEHVVLVVGEDRMLTAALGGENV